MKSEFLTTLVVDEKKDDSGAVLREAFVYYSERLGITITVPRGFETDFASVPRLPFAYTLFGGTAKWAAVLHDFLYRRCSLCISRKDADGVLYEAMGVCGMADWRRYSIWAGVRAFGWTAYQPYQSKPEAL